MKRVLQFSYFWFIAIYVLSAAAFYGNHTLIFPVVVVFFTSLAVFWFRKTNNSLGSGVLKLSGPVTALFLALILFSDSSSEILIAYITAAITTVASAKLMCRKKFLGFAVLLTVLPLIIFYIGVPNMRLISSNTKSSNLKGVSVKNFEMFNSRGNKIQWGTDDLIILDFWHTRCGACYTNFPHFEELKETFEHEPNLKFYSVNAPLPREVPDSSLALFRDLGYDITPAFVESREGLEKLFQFNSYPHYAVVHKSKILFSGKFDFSPVILTSRPDKIIRDILEATSK